MRSSLESRENFLVLTYLFLHIHADRCLVGLNLEMYNEGQLLRASSVEESFRVTVKKSAREAYIIF